MKSMNNFSRIKDVIGLVGKDFFTTDDIKISTNFYVQRLNPLVKTAILAVLAGYKENDNIVVYDKINLKKFVNIEKFVNLNLNFIGKAPRKFNVNIIYKKYPIYSTKQEQRYPSFYEKFNSYDTILLLSGGIDSTAAFLYSLEKGYNILPLWIDFGQKNRSSEKRVIKLLENKLETPILEVKIDLENYVTQGWKYWKQGIIPARNFLFLAFASLLIEKSKQKTFRIYLCASRGEINSRHNDKSIKFYKIISKLISLYTQKNVKVWTPFYRYNKTEIIDIWQKKWYSKYGISPKNATTCYLGNNCGQCSACYYRCISAAAAGIEDVRYKDNPFNDRGRIIRDYYIPNFGKWGLIRKIDFLIALSRNQKFLPIEVKNFYKSQFKLYRKEIKNRIKKLARLKI